MTAMVLKPQISFYWLWIEDHKILSLQPFDIISISSVQYSVFVFLQS